MILFPSSMYDSLSKIREIRHICGKKTNPAPKYHNATVWHKVCFGVVDADDGSVHNESGIPGYLLRPSPFIVCSGFTIAIRTFVSEI